GAEGHALPQAVDARDGSPNLHERVAEAVLAAGSLAAQRAALAAVVDPGDHASVVGLPHLRGREREVAVADVVVSHDGHWRWRRRPPWPAPSDRSDRRRSETSRRPRVPPRRSGRPP